MAVGELLGKLKYIVGMDDQYIEEIEEEEEIEIDLPVQKTLSKNNKVVNIHTTNNFKLVVYVPEKYDEVTKIVSDLKIRKLVVLNLENTNKDIKKQIFDFVNGAIFALEGTIQKVSKDIFIVAPNNVEINSSLKEELRTKGGFSWQKI